MTDKAPVEAPLKGACWQVFGERTLYDNPWVRLVKVDVEPPVGRRFEHHVLRLQRVAVAAVLDKADCVLMLWRHRFVTDQWGPEISRFRSQVKQHVPSHAVLQGTPHPYPPSTGDPLSWPGGCQGPAEPDSALV